MHVSTADSGVVCRLLGLAAVGLHLIRHGDEGVARRVSRVCPIVHEQEFCRLVDVIGPVLYFHQQFSRSETVPDEQVDCERGAGAAAGRVD